MKKPLRIESSELTVSVMDSRPNHKDTVCAIEVQDIPDEITRETLELFFESEQKSGSGHFEELLFYKQQRKAVVTFADPTGAALIRAVIPTSWSYCLEL